MSACMNSNASGESGKFRIWLWLSALVATAVVFLLLPIQFLGLALGCLIEITLFVLLWLLLRGRRCLGWLDKSYILIALVIVLMNVVHDWEMRVFRSYAEKIADGVLSGQDSVELIESSPWVLRLYCFGCADWLRNEIASMAADWSLLENAVRDRDEVAVNNEVGLICDRCDNLRSICKYGLPGRIAYWIAEKIRFRGLVYVGGISEGIFRRAQILSLSVLGKNSGCAGNSLLDVSLYANSEEYVTELCARDGCGNAEDVGLMKNEWSFAVGVPNDAPETFPMMISSNLDPARLPQENHGGTNFCGYVEAGCFPRCGSGRIVVVTKSGAVRVLKNCHLNINDDSDGGLTFAFNLRDIIGAEPYQLSENVYYLAPAGKAFPRGQ